MSNFGLSLQRVLYDEHTSTGVPSHFTGLGASLLLENSNN